MTDACRRLEMAETAPSLHELAAEAGLSPSHFQRRFREIVGLSPKQYASAQQARRFRAALPRAESVTQALYDAGFSSSSRAYENALDHLAMAPSVYRKGGAGLTIRYSVVPSFLGWTIVAATDRGICAIEFGEGPNALPAQLQGTFPKAELEEADAKFSATVERVIALIQTPGGASELPLDIQGTAFQRLVWRALQAIPSGTTLSYAELAERIAQPGSARAVAGACAANKLAVAIPCHRVVRGDGALSGYRWGVERKRALLQREAEQSRAPQSRTRT